jgi:type II secretory pathway component GspD/PulD (secretin)
MRLKPEPKIQKAEIKIRVIIFVIIAIILQFGAVFAQEQEAATTIREWLLNSLPPDPTNRRRIALYEQTGLLVVTATPTEHARIKKLIDIWERIVGEAQISIEARFIEVAAADLAEMGIEWQDVRHRMGEFLIDPRTGTEFGVPAARERGGFGILLGKTTLDRTHLQMYLHALQRQGKASLLSSPKITTTSGQAANIEITTYVPYAAAVEQTNIGTAERPIWVETYRIEERVAGIILEVTPTVALDSMIINLDLRPEVSILVDRIPIVARMPADLGWPIIDTRSVQTSVSVRSGQTIVMGGLITDEDRETGRKVPVLGSIPLIGRLFRYTTQTREKRNLVIFLTATLITPEGDPFEGH